MIKNIVIKNGQVYLVSDSVFYPNSRKNKQLLTKYKFALLVCIEIGDDFASSSIYCNFKL